MIVDCFTLIWEAPQQLGRAATGRAPTGHGGPNDSLPPATIARHLAASRPVGATIVVGFKSRYLDAEVPNAHIAQYVRSHPDTLLGFAGIDPAEPRSAIADLQEACEGLQLAGVAVAPAAQDFHPSASHAMQFYAAVAERGLPLLFHAGPTFHPSVKLEYARPYLLDEAAREFPNLKIIIAHVGHPWIAETLALLRKHEHVFAEISWLLQYPWETYQGLVAAHQQGVMEKLLFGSGFPYSSPAACIEALYSINGLGHGTNLPTIPREQLRGIVERDALRLLGIRAGAPKVDTEPQDEPGRLSSNRETNMDLDLAERTD